MDIKEIFSNKFLLMCITGSVCGVIALGAIFKSKQGTPPDGGVAGKTSLSANKNLISKEGVAGIRKSDLKESVKPQPLLVSSMPVDFKPSAELLMGAAPDTNLVALTFDAGSDAKAVPQILKALKDRNLHVTFFLTGRFCEHFPAECRAIADAGMEIGNHSFNHPHFTKLSEKQIIEQLDKSEEIITRVCGRGAKPLFRFPFGDCNARTQQIVAAQGYQSIRWTLDSLDSIGQKKSAGFVEARIMKKIKPGYITLMHVSEVGSAEALPAIFDQLDKMGVKIVTVSEILKSKPILEELR